MAKIYRVAFVYEDRPRVRFSSWVQAGDIVALSAHILTIGRKRIAPSAPGDPPNDPEMVYPTVVGWQEMKLEAPE